MIELFNNEQNKELVFNVDTEGMDKSNLEVRMLVMTKEGAKNMFFISDVVDGKVRFSLPPLNELNESQEGKLRLEVVAEGEYFKPWESDFLVKTKRSLKVTSSVEESVSVPAKKVVMELTAEPVSEAAKPKTKLITTEVKPVVPVKKVVESVEKPKEVAPKKVVKPVSTSNVADPDYKPLSFEDFLSNSK